jgi:hypothetical protein
MTCAYCGSDDESDRICESGHHLCDRHGYARCPIPNCGANTKGMMKAAFVDPFLDIGRALIPKQGSAATTSTGSGGCGGVLGGLIVLGVAAIAIYWFVTIVLPVLLAIVATLALVTVLFYVLRFCGRTFGWAATLKGLALAILVPLIIVGYIAAFVGDFEVATDGVQGYAEPRSIAAQCGPSLSEGDNLSFVGAPQTSDNLEGRWAHVSVKGSNCWLPYERLTFQRGLWMTLVGKIARLSSTLDEDRLARIRALGDLDQQTLQLQRMGSWEQLAQLGQRLRQEQSQVSATIATRVEEADERLLFGRLLVTFCRAPVSCREDLFRRILGLHVPSV